MEVSEIQEIHVIRISDSSFQVKMNRFRPANDKTDREMIRDRIDPDKAIRDAEELMICIVLLILKNLSIWLFKEKGKVLTFSMNFSTSESTCFFTCETPWCSWQCNAKSTNMMELKQSVNFMEGSLLTSKTNWSFPRHSLSSSSFVIIVSVGKSRLGDVSLNKGSIKGWIR